MGPIETVGHFLDQPVTLAQLIAFVGWWFVVKALAAAAKRAKNSPLH